MGKEGKRERESQSMVVYDFVGPHFYLCKQHLAACIQYQETPVISLRATPTYLSILIHQHQRRTHTIRHRHIRDE